MARVNVQGRRSYVRATASRNSLYRRTSILYGVRMGWEGRIGSRWHLARTRRQRWADRTGRLSASMRRGRERERGGESVRGGGYLARGQ
jgi:hypothetical protein